MPGRGRQALGVMAVAAVTGLAVELARQAGASGWLLAAAGLPPAAAGAWWLDRQWRSRLRQEEHRQWMLEAVLDEFRSRATAVTLAAGMFRRPGNGAGPGLAPAGDDRGDARPRGEDRACTLPREGDRDSIPPAAVSLGDAERRQGQVLVHLEAEAEMLRVTALQMACWLRLQAGRVRPERERVDLAAVAERVARRLAVVARARQVELGFAGRPGPAMVVRGDRALLELLCTSLVAAALERCRPGGRLTVQVDGDGAAVTLCLAGAISGHGGRDPARGAGGGDGGPAGNRWRRGVASPLPLALAEQLLALHGARRRGGGGLPWVVEFPAAHGPFAILRPAGRVVLTRRRDARASVPGKGTRVAGLLLTAAGLRPRPAGARSPRIRPVRPVSRTGVEAAGEGPARQARRVAGDGPGTRGDGRRPTGLVPVTGRVQWVQAALRVIWRLWLRRRVVHGGRATAGGATVRVRPIPPVTGADRWPTPARDPKVPPSHGFRPRVLRP
ncbi:HAMP domain-containing histidine kinase [Thermaerobacter marianensis]|nr:HAMP domain-containing histidine kinase [Thermaerobacter marianensis]